MLWSRRLRLVQLCLEFGPFVASLELRQALRNPRPDGTFLDLRDLMSCLLGNEGGEKSSRTLSRPGMGSAAGRASARALML